MRVALISDTHGNFSALQAVLADLPAQGADQVVFLGDASTIGPQPVETLDALRELNCVSLIMGNHDAAVLDPARATELQVAPNLHTSITWCIDHLRPDHFDFIRSFQDTFTLALSDKISLLCYHGSPLSCTDQILSTTPEENFEKFFAGRTSTVWAGGHTHIQMFRRHNDKVMINAGSVGNAFYHSFEPGVVPRLLPWAEYAIVSAENEIVTVHLRRVPYDTRETLSRVRQTGVPSMEWWLDQYK
ncbi:MAG: metallophosphoesterase family protein [Anaerolineales bacterium]|nr:metallophosphoesterase family protein [Anaerolineales bacterium]